MKFIKDKYGKFINSDKIEVIEIQTEKFDDNTITYCLIAKTEDMEFTLTEGPKSYVEQECLELIEFLS